MLRISFTPADLGRVRLAAAPNPLWETVFAMYRMRDHHLDLTGAAWCRDAMRRRRIHAVNALTNLVPGGYYPDFLTPTESHLGVEAGLDALKRTPRVRLRREVDLLLARRPSPPPSWMSDLRDGKSRAVVHVADAVRQVHDDVLAENSCDRSAAVELPLMVVGVDGSPASRIALCWALIEAKRSGAAIEATMAWQHAPEFSHGVHPQVLPRHHHPARVLHDLVTQIRDELPGAPEVAEVTITGDASTALLRASRQADLLVVGRHAHGPLTEALLGGVTSDCIRHSACPVVVIPPGVTTSSADTARVAVP